MAWARLPVPRKPIFLWRSPGESAFKSNLQIDQHGSLQTVPATQHNVSTRRRQRSYLFKKCSASVFGSASILSLEDDLHFLLGAWAGCSW